MNQFKVIYEDLKNLHNIDQYLALLLGIIGGIIGILGADTHIVIATTSAVLTLVAFGSLQDRRNQEALKEYINSQRQLAIRPAYFEEVLEVIKSATQTLDILSWGGLAAAHFHLEHLRAALRRGCTIRIIFCSPDEATINHMFLREYETSSPEELRQKIDITISKLKLLARSIEHDSNFTGHLWVRTTLYTPSMTMNIADRGLPDGKVYALVRAFRSPSRNGLSVRLKHSENTQIFKALETEFEKHWESGKIVKLTEDEPSLISQ